MSGAQGEEAPSWPAAALPAPEQGRQGRRGRRETGDGRARQPRAEARGRGRPPGTVRKAERPTHAKRPNLVTVTDRNKGKEDGLAL